MSNQELSDYSENVLAPSGIITSFKDISPGQKNIVNFALHSILSGKDFRKLDNGRKFEEMCNLFSKKLGAGEPYVKHFQCELNKGSFGKTIADLMQSETLIQKLTSIIKPSVPELTDDKLPKDTPSQIDQARSSSDKEPSRTARGHGSGPGSAKGPSKSSPTNPESALTTSLNQSPSNNQKSELFSQPSTEEHTEDTIHKCGINVYENGGSMYLVPFQIKVKKVTKETTGLIFKTTSNSLDFEIKEFKFLLTKSDMSAINEKMNSNL